MGQHGHRFHEQIGPSGLDQEIRMLKTLLISTAFLLALMACSSDEEASLPSQSTEESASHPTASPPTVAAEKKQDSEASVSWPTGIGKTRFAANAQRPPNTQLPATLPPELANVVAPAVNKPLEIKRPTPLPPIEPKLPDDGLPALQTFIDGKHFEGTFHGSGDVEVTTDSIKMDAGPKGTVKILYRMPAKMGMLAPRTLKGELGLSDLTTIEDRNRVISLRDDKGLYFAEVWQREQSPIGFQIFESLKLQQTEVGGALQSDTVGTISPFIHSDVGGETSSRIQLIDGDFLITEVEPGTVADIQSPIGPFKVFVSESQFSEPPPGTPGVRPAYVLRLWIARAR